MRYIVTASSMNLFTNEVHPARNETIDTETNSLFADCETEQDVVEVYEAFWNIPMAREVVRVWEVSPMLETA